MLSLEDLGRLMLILGIAFAVLGLLLLAVGRIPGVGRLPGDLVLRTDGVTCFVPIATMLLLSVLLTILVNVIVALLRR